MSYLDLSKLLDASIFYEEQTVQFYQAILSVVQNETIQTLVKTLTDQELKHIGQLRAFKTKMTDSAFSQFNPELTFPYPLEGQDFSKISLKTLLEMALTVEKVGWEFYRNLSENAQNDSTREFFATLMRFEQSHIDLLAKQSAYD